MRLTCAFLVLALAGCADEPGPPEIDLPGTAVSFEVLTLGLTPSGQPTAGGVEWWSGYEAPARLVLRDEAAWLLAWQTVKAGYSPVPPLPVIDFEREMVVLAALGTRYTTGYVPSIEAVALAGDTLSVAVLETRPGDGCFTGQALTYPAVAVRVARSDAEVRFVEYGYDRGCE